MPYRAVNLARVHTYPLPERQSRVALEHLIMPDAPCLLSNRATWMKWLSVSPLRGEMAAR